MPLLADLSNEISFNEKLFQRIKYVYDHERGSLKGEDLKLLEETYKDFVRSGALLSKEDGTDEGDQQTDLRPPATMG